MNEPKPSRLREFMKDNDITVEETVRETKMVISSPDIIPKFCTNINISLLPDGNVILAALFQDTPEQASILGRFYITRQHAEGLRDMFNKVLTAPNVQ